MATTTSPSPLESFQASSIPGRVSIPLSQRTLRSPNGGVELTLRDTFQSSSSSRNSGSDILNPNNANIPRRVVPLDIMQSTISPGVASGCTPDLLVKSGWLYKRGKRKVRTLLLNLNRSKLTCFHRLGKKDGLS